MRNESQGPVGRDYLEDLSIDDRVILKGDGIGGRALDRDRYRAFANTALNLSGIIYSGNVAC
jgi:hypothetical protein